jgi:hypothetical protein
MWCWKSAKLVVTSAYRTAIYLVVLSLPGRNPVSKLEVYRSVSIVLPHPLGGHILVVMVSLDLGTELVLSSIVVK